jgi:uncharacterized protein YbjT (DUF2867 family)
LNCALFGISGLIGSATAPLLVSSFDKVIAPVRKAYFNDLINIKTQEVDFERLLSDHRTLLHNIDCVVYCLGTTLKKAKSINNFRKVEWNLATSVSTLAKESGVRRFVLLSASGASADSIIPYSQTKGQIERFITELRFAELLIAKPSLLVGDRAETRVIEGISVKLTAPLLKSLQRWVPKVAPIQDIQVARALAKAATMPLKKPVTILTNDELISLGGPPIRNVICAGYK